MISQEIETCRSVLDVLSVFNTQKTNTSLYEKVHQLVCIKFSEIHVCVLVRAILVLSLCQGLMTSLSPSLISPYLCRDIEFKSIRSHCIQTTKTARHPSTLTVTFTWGPGLATASAIACIVLTRKFGHHLQSLKRISTINAKDRNVMETLHDCAYVSLETVM